jgi:hypothetical protein
MRCRLPLLLGCMGLLLAACAGQRQVPVNTAPKHPTETLEQRLEALSSQNVIQEQPPNADEIRAQIQALEQQRAKLLVRYTPQYPDVVLLDHQLLRLRAELQKLQKP